MTADQVDNEAGALLGKTWTDGKRIARMLATRGTKEDNEAAGFLAAMLFRVANAEAAEQRLRAMLLDLIGDIGPKPID